MSFAAVTEGECFLPRTHVYVPGTSLYFCSVAVAVDLNLGLI